jgi:hypothetical protein
MGATQPGPRSSRPLPGVVPAAVAICVALVSGVAVLAEAPGSPNVTASFFYKHELPDGTIVSVDLPGTQQYTVEVATRIRVPIYDQAQAAVLGLELLQIGKAEHLSQVLCGQRMAGESPLVMDSRGAFDLCLQLPESLAARNLHVELPGEPRYAVRDDGEPLLLFSEPQCAKLLSALSQVGIRLPIAATTLAGFKAAPPGTRNRSDAGTPIRPGCGECASGETCVIGLEKDCCDAGSGSCQSCRSCLRKLNLTLDLSQQ